MKAIGKCEVCGGKIIQAGNGNKFCEDCADKNFGEKLQAWAKKNKTMELEDSIGVMNEIITNISRTLSIPIDDIKSKSRKRKLGEARVIFVNFSENAGVHSAMVTDFINRHRTMIYYLRKAYIDWQSDLQFQKLLAKFDESEKNEMSEEKKKYVDFFLWFRENGERYIGLSIEELVDKYLENVERKE